jgi:hypothetical protein
VRLKSVESIKLDLSKLEDDMLRDLLVQISLEWERRFAVAPRITADVAEYDAAKLVGTSIKIGRGRRASDTAVMKGVDFRKGNEDYQVKCNRPSGKPGSVVTLVGKATTFDWDKLVWILYDREYKMQEAYEFTSDKYIKSFKSKKRLSPEDMRQGTRLYRL